MKAARMYRQKLGQVGTDRNDGWAGEIGSWHNKCAVVVHGDYSAHHRASSQRVYSARASF